MIQQQLDYARQLQESRLKYGVDGIRQFVSDVDGNWLEKWSDNEMKINYVSATYYVDDKQLVITTNFEHIVITVNNLCQEDAEQIAYDLTNDRLNPLSYELYVIPKRKDGYKLSEFGLGK